MPMKTLARIDESAESDDMNIDKTPARKLATTSVTLDNSNLNVDAKFD